jgi:ABC-2 type transport system ATP-binding protein
VRTAPAAAASAAAVLAGLGLAQVAALDDGASAILGAGEPEPVVAALVGAGVGVRGFAVDKPRHEDVFVELTGDGFDVSG